MSLLQAEPRTHTYAYKIFFLILIFVIFACYGMKFYIFKENREFCHGPDSRASQLFRYRGCP
jgi:hypothetical protein